MRLAATGNDLLSWFNDLASLERDRVTAGGHNLVLAIAAERGVPVDRRRIERRRALAGGDAALRRAARRDALASARRWTRRSPTHLDGIANAVRGTVDWTLESARYALPHR